MYFPQVLKLVVFLVDVFLERVNNPVRLMEQFIYRNWKSKVAVLQEGQELLPRCDHCGMHIPEARMIKHRQTKRCNKTADMRLIQRNVEMEERCGDTEFSLYGGEGGALLEGVVTFKYLGRPLDQTDDDWMAIIRKRKRVSKVWGRLGKMFIREGADTRVLEMFYRAVAQAVLLFGLYTWVLLEVMERKLERTHTGFLRQITGKRSERKEEGMWVNTRAEVVWGAAGNQSEMTYTGRRNGTMAQWVGAVADF